VSFFWLYDGLVLLYEGCIIHTGWCILYSPENLVLLCLLLSSFSGLCSSSSLNLVAFSDVFVSGSFASCALLQHLLPGDAWCFLTFACFWKIFSRVYCGGWIPPCYFPLPSTATPESHPTISFGLKPFSSLVPAFGSCAYLLLTVSVFCNQQVAFITSLFQSSVGSIDYNHVFHTARDCCYSECWFWRWRLTRNSSRKWQWWPCFLCLKDQLSFLHQIDLCTLCRISSRLQFGRILTLHRISVWGWSGKHYYLGLKEHCRVLFLQELYCCMSCLSDFLPVYQWTLFVVVKVCVHQDFYKYSTQISCHCHHHQNEVPPHCCSVWSNPVWNLWETVCCIHALSTSSCELRLSSNCTSHACN
jgi:hypothetical protein